MSSFRIIGGKRLKGEIQVQGAKNEALQVICAVLLTDEPVVIENIPDIRDVNNLISILEFIGCKVLKIADGTYSFQCDDIERQYNADWTYVGKIPYSTYSDAGRR